MLFQSIRSKVLAGLIVLCSIPAIAAAPILWAGNLSGLDTVDYAYFTAVEGTQFNYNVTATGNGSNKLTVKVQQKWPAGTWETIEKSKTPVGNPGAGAFVVHNHYVNTPIEELRYRISRKAFTRAIDWTVSH